MSLLKQNFASFSIKTWIFSTNLVEKEKSFTTWNLWELLEFSQNAITLCTDSIESASFAIQKSFFSSFNSFSFHIPKMWMTNSWQYPQIVKDNAFLEISYNHLAQKNAILISKLKLLSLWMQCTFSMSLFCTNQKHVHAFNRTWLRTGKRGEKASGNNCRHLCNLNELKIHVRCGFVAIAHNLKWHTKNKSWTDFNFMYMLCQWSVNINW